MVAPSPPPISNRCNRRATERPGCRDVENAARQRPTALAVFSVRTPVSVRDDERNREVAQERENPRRPNYRAHIGPATSGLFTPLVNALTHAGAMTACGIQALMLRRQASTAAHFIPRVPQFIENVLLKNYRLWRGIQDALISSA
jgi:hypothetical protein